MGNPNLACHPAKLCGYERIFAGASKPWRNSGMASVWKTNSLRSVTYGSAVELTDLELDILDCFDGGEYQREPVSIRVALEPGISIMDEKSLESVDSYVYIKWDTEY